MARIRSIKPEFWTDEKVVSLTPLARLLFIGMWNFVDDEGRAEYSPARMKMQILPADSADISELLGEIRRENLIHVYEVDNKQYFQVCGFAKHQKVDARRASKLPPPPRCAELRRIAPTDQGRDQGKEPEADASGADARALLFDLGLKSVMRQTGKTDGQVRRLLGHWLKLARDDAAKILTKINQAEADRRADPVAWIEGAIRWDDDPRKRLRGFGFG